MEVNAQMANVSSEQENIQTFYREQNELLFRYAMLLTGDRHQAEEALQTAWYRETFFRVPEEKRPAWMRTVASLLPTPTEPPKSSPPGKSVYAECTDIHKIRIFVLLFPSQLDILNNRNQ